jgi:hypothetical protein
MATSGDFCIVAVDDGKGALAEFPALLVAQFVACLPRPFSRGENLVVLGLLFFGGRLFHFKKGYTQNGRLPSPPYFTEFTSGARP